MIPAHLISRSADPASKYNSRRSQLLAWSEFSTEFQDWIIANQFLFVGMYADVSKEVTDVVFQGIKNGRKKYEYGVFYYNDGDTTYNIYGNTTYRVSYFDRRWIDTYEGSDVRKLSKALEEAMDAVGR